MPILNFIKTMSRPQKQVTMLGLDLALVPLALLFTLGLQDQGPVLAEFHRAGPVVGLLMVLGAALSLVLGIPKIQLKAYDLSGIGRTAVFAGLLAFSAFVLGRTAAVSYTHLTLPTIYSV